LAYQDSASVSVGSLVTSGNVGIGTSTPNTKLDVYLSGTTSTILRARNDTTSVYLDANNGYSYLNTFSNHPMLFGTNNTERMRIDSSGNLLVGTTVTDPRNLTSGSGCAIRANVNAAFEYASSDASSCFINNTNSGSGAATFIGFRQQATTRGTITTNGSSVAYNTTSDYRLKENIAPMTSALAVVGQLKPCTYTWKSTGEASQGFIAHELAEVVPDCVTGEKDAVDEEGNPQYQGIDTSFLVATLTAAIQEQQAIINDLKARIETLESK
jgi:hypothetical protein